MATLTKTLNFPANDGMVSVTLTLNYSITTNNATTHTITVSNVVLKNNASVTAAQVNTTNVKDFTVVYGGTTLWTFNTSFALGGGTSKTLTINKTSTTNKTYNSTQEKTLSLRCRPVTYSSVQVANATISIPARTRVISSVTLSASTLRVGDGQSVSEEDEGTWCYGTCDYSIVGDASADVSFNISVTPSGPTIQPYENSANKSEDTTLSGTLVFRASDCSTDLSYKFTITATAQNTSDTSQAAVTKSINDVLSLAYYTMDVLGDNYWDRQTQTGERPGHGVAFGMPCKKEGFHVGMDPRFYGDVMFPETDPGFVFENTDQSKPTITHWRMTMTGYGNFRLDSSSDGGVTWTNGVKYFAAENRTWPVANGGTGATSVANAQKNLGITAGNVSMSATANNYVDTSVSFGKTYTSAPTVVVGFYSSSTAAAFGGLTVAVHSITTTGCKVRVFNNTSSNRSPSVHWVAVGS